MNDEAVLKLNAGPTAPRCWGLRGRDPWIRKMTYVKSNDTAEKTIIAPA